MPPMPPVTTATRCAMTCSSSWPASCQGSTLFFDVSPGRRLDLAVALAPQLAAGRDFAAPEWRKPVSPVLPPAARRRARARQPALAIRFEPGVEPEVAPVLRGRVDDAGDMPARREHEFDSTAKQPGAGIGR